MGSGVNPNPPIAFSGTIGTGTSAVSGTRRERLRNTYIPDPANTSASLLITDVNEDGVDDLTNTWTQE